MKLRYKMILAMLFVGAAPLSIAGYQAFLHSRAAVEERIRETLARISQAEAEIIGREITTHIRTLQLVAGTIQVDEEEPGDPSDALERVYLLSEIINAVALFDPDGNRIGQTFHAAAEKPIPEKFAEHETMDGEEITRFHDHALRSLSNSGRAAISPVYVSERKRVPLIAVTVPAGGPGPRRFSLVAELSLSRLQRRFELLRIGKSGFAFMVDAHGMLICHPNPSSAFEREDLSDLGILKGRLGSTNAAVADYQDSQLGDMVGAFAPVPRTRWSLVVTQPKKEALKPVNILGVHLVSWLMVGLALAGMFGLILSSRITRPVKELVKGAQAIASGNLKHEIRVRSGDEIGKLGETFNMMGKELQKHQAQIEEQTEEIKRWNVELQDRVQERTHELKEAQGQLIQAQKMAAMGEIGAGLAHEVNNPLMGVLGCAQLLLMRYPEGHPDHGMLADIEKEAQRIRGIVSRLLEASQVGEAGMARINLGALASHVSSGLKERFEKINIQIDLMVPDNLPPVLGNSEQLERVVYELLVNASHAMPDGGGIRIVCSGTEGKLVKLEVVDTGSGVAPENLERVFEPFFTTKQNWEGKGLGLTSAYQIMQAHNGMISVTSTLGKGSRFSLSFPALRHSAHLR